MQFSRDRLESRHFSSAELCSGRGFSALSSGVLLFELAWMPLQNWARSLWRSPEKFSVWNVLSTRLEQASTGLDSRVAHIRSRT